MPYLAFSPHLLRQRRREAGVTREKAAVASGHALNTLGRWERGEFTPIASDLAALAHLYGCSPADFFVEVDDAEAA